MTESDVQTYSGLRLIPAALALLDREHDNLARTAIEIRQVEREGSSGSWTEAPQESNVGNTAVTAAVRPR